MNTCFRPTFALSSAVAYRQDTMLITVYTHTFIPEAATMAASLPCRQKPVLDRSSGNGDVLARRCAR